MAYALRVSDYGEITTSQVRRRSDGKNSEWVTKTDVSRCFRCPYAFWLIDSGQISPKDTVSEFELELISEGAEFHEAVTQSAEPMDIGTVTDFSAIAEAVDSDVLLLDTPDLENPTLKIRGRPDGVDPAGGAFLPVEIKSHKSVQRIDELELAFYWLLLEPQRTRQSEPKGILVLRREDRQEQVEVPIRAHRFDEVRELVERVRTIRREGVRPRICGCTVCRGLRAEDVLAATQLRKDLTLVFGIGPAYATALESVGIATMRLSNGLGRLQFCPS